MSLSENKSPASLKRLGLLISEASTVESVWTVIDVPAYQKGSAPKPFELPLGKGNMGEGLTAFALFLLIQAIRQRSAIHPGVYAEAVLSGGTNSPAQSLVFALMERDGKPQKWHRDLFGFPEVYSKFLNHCVRSRHPSSTNDFEVHTTVQFPNVEFIHRQKQGKPAIYPAIHQTPATILSIDQLVGLAENLLKSAQSRSHRRNPSRKQWENYSLPAEVVNATAADTLEREAASLPEYLLKWLSHLETDLRWTSVSVPPQTRLAIRDIYTELYLAEEDLFPSIEAGSFDFTEPRKSKYSKTTSVDSFLMGMMKHGIIVGEPGAGKSTLIKSMAARLDKRITIPIVILLRDFAEHAKNSFSVSLLNFFLTTECHVALGNLDAVATEMEQLHHSPDHPEILLLLDGWDEVPGSLKLHVMLSIQRERQRFRTVVTTRPSGIPSTIAEGADRICTLARMSHAAARNLVQNICRFMGRSEVVSQIFQRLDSHSSLLELAGNPFTLTMLCQIACHQRQDIWTTHTVTEVMTRMIDLIRIHQETQLHLPSLTTKDIEFLRRKAAEMCFRANGKSLYFQSLDRKTTFAETAVAKSRIIDRQPYQPDTYSFVHLRYQEFFAGTSLQKIDPRNLTSLLEQFALSWNWLEEWKFAAGTLAEGSSNHRVFWDFWADQIKMPDLFGGVFCIIGNLLAETKAADGGTKLLGHDIRKELINNIGEGNWPLESARNLVRLDLPYFANFLKHAAIEHPNYDFFCEAFEMVSSAARRDSGLNEALRHHNISTRSPRSFLISQPDDLSAVRKIIRDRNCSSDERREAFQSLAGYRDEESVVDAAILLQSNQWILFHGGATELANLGGSEAAMALAKRLVELLIETPLPQEHIELLVAKLNIRHSGAIEAHSRDFLLAQIAILPLDDLRLVPLLGALNDLPLSQNASPIFRIIENSNIKEIRLAAASSIAACTDQLLVARCFEQIRVTSDSQLRDELLSSLSKGRHRLYEYFQEFFDALLDNTLPYQRRVVILRLLQNGEISDGQKIQLDEYVVRLTSQLADGQISIINLLSKEAVLNLSPCYREEAADHLLQGIENPLACLEARVTASSLLGYCGSSSHALPLGQILNNYWSSNGNIDRIESLLHSLIEAMLRLNPYAVIKLLRENNWQDLTQCLSRLRRWSETQKVLIYPDAVITKDGYSEEWHLMKGLFMGK